MHLHDTAVLTLQLYKFSAHACSAIRLVICWISRYFKYAFMFICIIRYIHKNMGFKEP
jgi:hypothetical protein